MSREGAKFFKKELNFSREKLSGVMEYKGKRLNFTERFKFDPKMLKA